MGKSYLIDMDGVLVSGRTIIPGADLFIKRLRDANVKFLVLTNNPLYTQRDLAHRLKVGGLEIPADNIFTSAMATAKFLQSQKERGKAFVIGESGLTGPIHDIGWVITDHDPEYVVLGETLNYNFEMVTKAIRFVAGGAHFIATNPDPSGPSETGLVPACGALASLIEKASGMMPFFVGKPNPLMMRMALKYLGVHTDDAIMIGDRMDTDIIAGVQSGLETILVLSGITSQTDIRRFPYQPTRIVGSVAEIEP
ncbi:MAG TPA: HAD-IIA family hydrolase [Candidatus Hydrogenedentes bacterium]|nr:HAD-IIA family hydrolase [Candidatus Hydrogenedentota bacterium]HRK35931.1 HAD-IIA family hydrolase [Candidatus Hydrogenedentota bacterium]